MTPQTRAQTRSSAETAEAAEAVVRTAFAEIEAMRWDAVASLMHPVTLKRFREWQIDLARTSERQLDEGSRDHERNLPPEVAAWFDAQRKKEEEYWEQHGPRLSHTFAGIETIEELESLSAAELFARYLQAQDPREQALRQAQREGKEISIAGIEKKLMVEERVVIGSVAEDDSTVQVVCRTRSKLKLIPEDDEGRVEVITVRRTPEGWRILAGPSDSIFLEGPSYGIYGLQTEEEQEQALRELAEKVVTWPVEGGRRGAGVHHRVHGGQGAAEGARGRGRPPGWNGGADRDPGHGLRRDRGADQLVVALAGGGEARDVVPLLTVTRKPPASQLPGRYNPAPGPTGSPRSIQTTRSAVQTMRKTTV